jgi:hypothetical protein
MKKRQPDNPKIRYSRETLIAEARKKNPNLGDNAMITEGEWGYWVCDIYIERGSISEATP